MKKIFISLLFYFVFINLYASEIKFEKIVDGLNNPWSLSFVNAEKIIFTEKSGKLYTFNLKNKKLSEIDHNLNVLDYGQGGLLDVLYADKYVYISYSEDRGNRASSTSVAKGKLNQDIIEFKNIFRAEPPIESMGGSALKILLNLIFFWLNLPLATEVLVLQFPLFSVYEI